MDWGEKLLETVLGGFPMATKLVPQQWRRLAAARLQDINPFSRIAANEDLLRALRLAWIEAALRIDDAVLKATTVAEWQAEAAAVRKVSALMRNNLLDLRKDAFDRDIDVGATPIDVHLHELIVTVPVTMSRKVANTGHALTAEFCSIVASLTGWPLKELPAIYSQVAREGLPIDGSSASRTFGELVYAEFAETIKHPERYPEARHAFVVAIAGLGIELGQQTLAVLRGQSEQIDLLLDSIGGLSQQGGLSAWLQRVDLAAGQRFEALSHDVRVVGERVDITHSKVVAVEGALREVLAELKAARVPPSNDIRRDVDGAIEALREALDQDELSSALSDPTFTLAATAIDELIRKRSLARDLVSKAEAKLWRQKAALSFKTNPTDALEAYEHALELDQTDSAAWRGKGATLDALGRSDEAYLASVSAVGLSPTDASCWSVHGRVLGSLGRHEEAVRAYEKALAIRPYDVADLINFGGELGQVGQLERALVAFEQVIAIGGRDAAAWTNKGWVLGKLGREIEALEAHRHAVELEPNFSAGWANLGASLDNLGRSYEALGAFERANSIDPTMTVVWIGQASVLRKLNRLDEADLAIRKALALDANHAGAWSERASIFASRGLLEESVMASQRATELDSKSAVSWFNLGSTLGRLARYEEAAAAFTTALSCDEGDAESWVRLARSLGNLQRLPEALEASKRATQLAPDLSEAWSIMGRVLASMGRPDDGIESMSRAIDLDGSHSADWKEKGKMLAQAARHEEALTALEEASRLDANDSTLPRIIGTVLANLGRFGEAAQALQTATRHSPDDSDLWHQLAGVLRRANRLSDCIQAIDRTLELAPEFGDALNDRGVVLAIGGQFEEALACFERAIASDQEHVGARRNRVMALSELGRHEDAREAVRVFRGQGSPGQSVAPIASVEEAIAICRGLSDRHPGIYLPELASSLYQLSNLYSEVGGHQEALEPAKEAVEIYAQLAERHPDAFRSGLATLLRHLAMRYADLGRRHEALAPAEEAVAVCRELAELDPDAHRTELTISLNILADQYAGLGRRDDARGLVFEAMAARQVPAERLWSQPGLRRAQDPAPPGSVVARWMRFALLTEGDRERALDAVGAAANSPRRDRLVCLDSPLSFYDSARLLALRDPAEGRGQDMFFIAEANAKAGQSLHLDCNDANALHVAGRLWSPKLTTDVQIMDYARYFCFFVGGQDAAFWVIEPGQQLPWKAEVAAELIGRVTAMLQPVRLVQRLPNGLVVLTATVLNRASLFFIQLAVATCDVEAALIDGELPRRIEAGGVVMTSDDLLEQDLPLIPWLPE